MNVWKVHCSPAANTERSIVPAYNTSLMDFSKYFSSQSGTEKTVTVCKIPYEEATRCDRLTPVKQTTHKYDLKRSS